MILEVSGEQVTGLNDVVESVKKAKELGRTAVMLHIKSQDQEADCSDPAQERLQPLTSSMSGRLNP